MTMIPTVPVQFAVHDQRGQPVPRAIVRAQLDRTETYQGFVVPLMTEAQADETGVGVLMLFPNALGTNASAYQVTATHPLTGKKFLLARAVVPNTPCALHEIIADAPYPPRDASEQALIAAQGALSLVTAQAQIATAQADAAAQSASSAAEAVGDAQASAQSAQSRAQEALSAADQAATAAGISAGAAAQAQGHAQTAGQLTDQAQAATTAASDFADSAGTSAGQAQSSAQAAADSATTAQQVVNNAADSAGAAKAFAQQAGQQAVLATDAASHAALAASAAAGSAQQSDDAASLAAWRLEQTEQAAGQANAAKSQAQAARDDAVAVVTGGTASMVAAAGKLPIAGATPELDLSWFRPLMDLMAPMAPAILFGAKQPGALYLPSRMDSLWQDTARTVPCTIEAPVAVMDDLSGQGHHMVQATTTKRPVVSRRVNQILDNTSTLAMSLLLTKESGVVPIVTPNYGVAPDGTQTAIRLQLDSGASLNGYSLAANGFSISQLAAPYVFEFWARATTGTARIGYVGAGVAQKWTPLLTTDWVKIRVDEIGIAGSVFAYRFSSSAGQLSEGPQDVLIWHPSLALATDAHLPYQWVNTATDYDSDPLKFPTYGRTDGVDDGQSSATGGGSSTAFHFSAGIVPTKTGAAQTLFSDAGANTGYIVRLASDGKLQLSAGNGTAYTTVTSAAAVPLNAHSIIHAWSDGANLCVQVGDGPIVTTPRPAVSAGTAGFSLWKDNGAETGFFAGRHYGTAYRKDGYLTPAERALVRYQLARDMRITL